MPVTVDASTLLCCTFESAAEYQQLLDAHQNALDPLHPRIPLAALQAYSPQVLVSQNLLTTVEQAWQLSECDASRENKRAFLNILGTTFVTPLPTTAGEMQFARLGFEHLAHSTLAPLREAGLITGSDGVEAWTHYLLMSLTALYLGSASGGGVCVSDAMRPVLLMTEVQWTHVTQEHMRFVWTNMAEPEDHLREGVTLAPGDTFGAHIIMTNNSRPLTRFEFVLPVDPIELFGAEFWALLHATATQNLECATRDAPSPWVGSTTHCNKCGVARENLQVCQRCRRAYYCSKECQKADWKVHKTVMCKGLDAH